MVAPEDTPREAPSPAPRSPRQLLVSFTVFSLLPAVVVFAFAGDLRWISAWLYVGTLWVATAGTRLLIMHYAPALLNERASSIRRDDIAPWDRAILPVIALVGPLTSWILAGLSHRFGWVGGFPAAARVAAFAVLVGGSALVTWSMLVNPFFSAVVRLQQDRGQTAISKGPYRFVRHPGYLGMLVANLASPVLLDAVPMFIPIVIVSVLLVARTALEDRTLRAGLPGYADYARATTARLIPGLW